MKIIRLTLAITFTVCVLLILTEVHGQEIQKNISKNNAKIETEQQSLSCAIDSRFSSKPSNGTPHHTGYTGKPCIGNHDPNETCAHCHNHIACHDGPCVDGLCKDGTCRKCNGSCPKICPIHGKDRKDCPQDCQNNYLKNQFGYGPMQVCPGKTNGVCPVHGYAPCPHPALEIGQFLRRTFQPADRPYWGTQPLYVPREHYDPNFQPRFPRIRALFFAPPVSGQVYMSTTPPVPMPTYTTRGPRDFLNPNPPSIGY
ncbi:MAG: hypothetical protein LBU34_09575 [Planctomycetaceae bacterium]|jgi:hypothetical protein|nr:hypothetical protein [Planctomycetaceae bacterium]